MYDVCVCVCIPALKRLGKLVREREREKETERERERNRDRDRKRKRKKERGRRGGRERERERKKDKNGDWLDVALEKTRCDKVSSNQMGSISRGSPPRPEVAAAGPPGAPCVRCCVHFETI